MLVDLFEHYLSNNYIMLVATAESTFKLNQHLFMSRGNHTFKNIFSIDELNKVHIIILDHMYTQYMLNIYF